MFKGYYVGNLQSKTIAYLYKRGEHCIAQKLDMGVGKEGGGAQEPGAPLFLAIAGQSRPGLASLQ